MAEGKDKLVYPELSYKIVGCLFNVFNSVGPNHRESYYQKAVAIELKSAGLDFVEQYQVYLEYRHEKIGKNFLDFNIENKVILELKSGHFIRRSDFAQLRDYLKTCNYKLGIVACFTAKGVVYYRILNII